MQDNKPNYDPGRAVMKARMTEIDDMLDANGMTAEEATELASHDHQEGALALGFVAVVLLVLGVIWFVVS